MTWKRGFIRIWIVVSVIWMGVIGYLVYNDYANPDLLTRTMAQIPVICADARGQAGVDYSYDRDRGLHPPDRYRNLEWHDACWYTVDAYKRIYQPDPSIPISEIRQAGYASAISVDATPPPFPDGWYALRSFAIAGLLPPIGLLIVGAIVGWIFSGFRRQAST